MPATDSGAFDAEHPLSRDLVADCVHGGFCLPACPRNFSATCKTRSEELP